MEVRELLPDDEPVTVNAVLVLDLRAADLLRSVSESVRHKVRKAADLGAELVEDRSELARTMRSLYPLTMARVGARSHYDVDSKSLDRWVLDSSSVVLGARLGDRVEAVSVFCVAAHRAEYHINASSRRGRDLTAWLIWNAVERLRASGVETLNLGGGFRPGDGVYRFKEMFRGEARPLSALHQVYDQEMYDELSRGVFASREQKEIGSPAIEPPPDRTQNATLAVADPTPRDPAGMVEEAWRGEGSRESTGRGTKGCRTRRSDRALSTPR